MDLPEVQRHLSKALEILTLGPEPFDKTAWHTWRHAKQAAIDASQQVGELAAALPAKDAAGGR